MKMPKSVQVRWILRMRMGAGSARRFTSVRWGVARKIISAWFVTLPVTIALGGACAWIIGIVL